MSVEERNAVSGIFICHGVPSTGIVGAIVALAAGASVLMVLNLILVACALSNFASDLTSLVPYRRGL